ncbi:hypothetical protein ACA910_005714 [Epithemia clementina (nom. ined.)]
MTSSACSPSNFEPCSPQSGGTSLSSVSFPRTGKRGVPQQFPRRLYEMLESETQLAETSAVDAVIIISWSESGKAFHIRNISDFANTILSKYFRTKKFSSFQRNLNLYGFTKLRRGPEINMYAHSSFRRGFPEHLVQLRKAGNSHQSSTTNTARSQLASSPSVSARKVSVTAEDAEGSMSSFSCHDSHRQLQQQQQQVFAAAAAAVVFMASAAANGHSRASTPLFLKQTSVSPEASLSAAATIPMMMAAAIMSHNTNRKSQQQPGLSGSTKTTSRAISPFSSSNEHESTTSSSSSSSSCCLWSPATNASSLGSATGPSHFALGPPPPPLVIGAGASASHNNHENSSCLLSRTSTRLLPRWSAFASSSTLGERPSSSMNSGFQIPPSSPSSSSTSSLEEDGHESEEQDEEHIPAAVAATTQQHQPEQNRHDRGRLDLLALAMEQDFSMVSS